MRNLKRALSLTLASVMLLGMMVMGTSAASFPDVDDNDNVEAIEVLKATGVMIGDNGNFKPDENVTRNEMAVIMTNLLGLNASDFAGTCPFTDVPNWAQNYVAACYNAGIVAGRTATSYDGSATVKNVEAAAMMLRALGYFKNTEDYTVNGGFTNATVRQAAAIRLFDGVTGNANDAMNRNNVAQLALNALESDMVEFTGNMGWEFNGITQGYQSKYEPRKDLNNNSNGQKGYNYTNDPANSTTHQKEYLQLCEDLYDGKLIKNTRDNDDFNRPATTWKFNGKVIGSYMNTPDLVYTAEVKLGDIYKDLGLNEAVAAGKVDFSRNGKEENVATKITANNKVGSEDSNPALDTLGLSKTEDHKIGGNGVLTQVWYHSDTETADITMIDTYVGTIASVTPASGSADRYVTVTTKSVRANLNSKFETENFAAKDLIAYTCAYNDSTKNYDIITAKVLEKAATDVLTKWTGINVGDSANSFTAGGTYKYDVNAYIDVDGTPGNITGFTVDESELDVYCDDYGYAIYVSGVEGTKNYAVVIGKGETNPYGDQTTGVTLLLPDGTQKTVTAKWKTADNGSTVKLSEGTSTSAPVKTLNKNLVDDMLGDVVTYKVDKDGIYELTMGGLNSGKTAATGKWDEANYAADGDVTFVNGRSLLTLNCTAGTNASDAAYDKTIYTTEKTVFFVATENSKGEVVYNVYTGYREMPSLKTGAGSAIKGIGYVMNSDYTTQADAVFIAVSSVKGLSANRTFVVKQKDHEVITDSLGNYFVMPAIDADGNVITVNVDAKTLGADGQGLDNVGDTQITSVVSMSDVTKNSDDIITGATFDTATTNANFVSGKSYYRTTGVVAPLNGVIGLGSDVKSSAVYWAYTANTKFYEVNEDMNAITPVEANQILTDANDVIFFVADDDATASYKVVKTVIVQKVAEGTTPPPPSSGITSYSVGYLGNSDNSKNVQILIGGHRADGTFDHWLSKDEIEALNITADNLYIENKGTEIKTKFGLGQEGSYYAVATSADTDGTKLFHQFDKSPIAVFEITQFDGKKATGANVGTASATTAIDKIGYSCGFLKIHVEKPLELASGQADETLKVWLQIGGKTYTSADVYKNP